MDGCKNWRLTWFALQETNQDFDPTSNPYLERSMWVSRGRTEHKMKLNALRWGWKFGGNVCLSSSRLQLQRLTQKSMVPGKQWASYTLKPIIKSNEVKGSLPCGQLSLHRSTDLTHHLSLMNAQWRTRHVKATQLFPANLQSSLQVSLLVAPDHWMFPFQNMKATSIH